MTARQMTGADLPRVLDLWQTCFGDAPETVTALLDVMGREHLWVLGETEAMVTALPLDYLAPDGGEARGAYLYAVATRPDRRGRGLCRSLLAQVEDRLRAAGTDFTCLRPASPSLAEFYERLGYRPAFTCAERTVEGTALPGVRCLPVSSERYFQLRELQLRGGFLSMPPALLGAAGQGWVLEGPEDALACALWDGHGVPEYLGDPALAPALAAALGRETLTIRTPGETPFGWAKDLSGAGLPAGWLGPAFE